MSCPYKNVPHWYCDECGEELAPEDLYQCDNQQLCEDCLLKQFHTVAESL
jgi:formylmethanofuran dehydrogenase subunit E